MFWNAFWSIGILLSTLLSAPAATLSDALDNPQLNWVTGGDAPWTTQTAVSHDGIDAAQSGPLLDGQQSWIQTTIIGPGPLTFWWRVSSELGYDEFQFSIDGLEQINISGQVDWQSRQFDIPSGTHLLKWAYVKDSSDSGYDDLAWLDQVSYVPPADAAPVIDSGPASQSVALGGTVSFIVQGRGTPEPAYRWYFNGTIIPLATNSILTLSPVATNQSGSYIVTLSNYLGSATSSPAILVVNSIGDAVEAPELSWIVGGAFGWSVQTAVTHDGVDAAISGSITSLEESWVQTVVRGPGWLSFWWRVSSEPFYDGLQFLTNGAVAASLSGDAAWEQKTFVFPAGDHSLRWRYFKDGSISLYQDRGWLDEVIFIPNKAPASLTLSSLSPVNEGDLLALSGSFVDPDPPEPHTVEVDWGDDSLSTVSNLPPGILSFTFSHRYLDDNPTGTSADAYAIRVLVSDQVGSASATANVQVRNLSPVLHDIAITSPVFSKLPVSISGSFADNGAFDTHLMELDWGDGSPIQTNSFALGVSTFEFRHQYLVGNTNVTLRLVLRDDDGGVAFISTNIFVMLPTQPRIASSRALPGGRINLQLQGTPGVRYQLQSSPDLKNWLTVAIRTADTNGLFQWVESEILRSHERFYRGLWQLESDGVRLTRIEKLSNGRMALGIVGVPGASYQLQFSSTLKDWTSSTNIVLSPDGSLTFEDSSPPIGKRFYRLSTQ